MTSVIAWLSAHLDTIAVLTLMLGVLQVAHVARATTRRVTAVELVVDGLALDLRERHSREHPRCRAATKQGEAR